MLDNYDFEALIEELGSQIVFQPFDTKLIFEDLNLNDIQHLLTILCDLQVIKDFQLGQDWSLHIERDHHILKSN